MTAVTGGFGGCRARSATCKPPMPPPTAVASRPLKGASSPWGLWEGDLSVRYFWLPSKHTQGEGGMLCHPGFGQRVSEEGTPWLPDSRCAQTLRPQESHFSVQSA